MPFPRLKHHEQHPAFDREPEYRTCLSCSDGKLDDGTDCPKCKGTGEVEIDEPDQIDYGDES